MTTKRPRSSQGREPILLCNAFRAQERRSYLSAAGKQNVPEANRNDHGGEHR